MDELNVDIVHALGVFPDFALSRMKYPGHVTTLRNYVYEDYPVKFGKILGTIMAKMHLYAMKRTNQTWTCSASLAKKYKQELNLEFPYIQNGVNVSNFTRPIITQKEEMRKKLGLPIDKKIYVYAGQFVARKDQKFLLELFTEEKMLKNHILLLLGDGADFLTLKEKYKNVNNIIMPGSVNNVNEYLQASDVYIASSKSEGLPNGVLEAMAVGLPVILSDIEQHKEVYEANQNIGVLYQIGNKKDCLHKILALDENEQIICSDEAYKCAYEQFSAERMSRQYQNEYKRLYGERHK